MSLGNPIEAFLRMAEMKNKNRQEMNQNISGLGQGLGNSMEAISRGVEEQKKKQIIEQLVQAMKQQGQPQQGPPLAPMGTPQPNLSMIPPGQPMSAGGNIGQDVQMPQPIPTQGPGQPTSGIGAPAQDNTQQINSLMMQYNPEQTIKSMLSKQKQSSPWRVVSGMLSKNGKPVQQNEQTGEVREVNLDVSPTGRGSSTFGTKSKWEEMPPEMQDLGKQAYDGNIEIEKLGFREKTQAILAANEYARVNKLAPFQTYTGTIRAGTRKAFAFGKPAQNVLSLNTALGHAKSALDAFQEVQNTDTRLLNIPLNKARSMTNNPSIIKLGVTLNALQGELATVFKGTAGTDQEIGKWMKYLSEDLTPTQAVQAIRQVNDLLNSRLNALTQMREQGTSNRPSTGSLLSPYAKKLTKQFNEMGSKSTGGLTPQEQSEFERLDKKFGGK